MPSRGNPNVPSKLRRKANRSKVQKRNATSGKITKVARGTAPGAVLYPTSGPAAPLSSKKARKVEKAKNHARQRALEKALAESGEVVMTDAPKITQSKTKITKGEVEIQTMDIDEAA